MPSCKTAIGGLRPRVAALLIWRCLRKTLCAGPNRRQFRNGPKGKDDAKSAHLCIETSTHCIICIFLRETAILW